MKKKKKLKLILIIFIHSFKNLLILTLTNFKRFTVSLLQRNDIYYQICFHFILNY